MVLRGDFYEATRKKIPHGEQLINARYHGNSFKFLPSPYSPPHFSFPACPLNIARERLLNQPGDISYEQVVFRKKERDIQRTPPPPLSLSLFSFVLSFFHSPLLGRPTELLSANDLNARKRFTNLLVGPQIGRLRYLERNTYQRISRDPLLLLTMSPVSPGYPISPGIPYDPG